MVYCWVEETAWPTSLCDLGGDHLVPMAGSQRHGFGSTFASFEGIIPSSPKCGEPHGTVFVFTRAGTSIGDLVETRV